MPRRWLPSRTLAPPVTPTGPGDQPVEAAAFAGAIAPVAERVLVSRADRLRFTQSQAQFAESGVRDFEFATDLNDAQPEHVFDRLRWGGLLVFVSAQPRETEALLAHYRDQPEWLIEQEPEPVTQPRFEKLDALHRLPLPASLRRLLLEKRAVYFTARKVLIDSVDRLTAKYSYDVRLERARGKADKRYATDGFVVLKRVPTMEQAIARLQQTCPGVPPARLEAIAAKLVRKVFPIFLTREAAFLKLLQRDLPPDLKTKTPRVMSMEADDNGLVRAMSLKWLRQGGEPISQTDFARQAAELLRALHQQAGVLHLDLRLDNLLVTDAGVCIIDFGSSVRVGEDLSTTATIETMIREMLAASQITRDLERQRRKNLIRSDVFAGLPHPPSPAFDLFALATNMTRPHDNADFKGLVTHDRDSDEGRYFSLLRRRILKPTADEPQIRSVHDLCVELGVPPAKGDNADKPHHAKNKLRPVISDNVLVPPTKRPDTPIAPGISGG
ncbi:MAG: phosphotransferase [Planctomycetota bacterium]